MTAIGWNKHEQCNVSSSRDIVSITAGWRRTIGLKANGTAVAKGRNGDGECNVGGWHELVGLAAGDWHTIGLGQHQCDVSDWIDVVAISAGSNHTVGLISDGTAVAAGWNEYGQCNVSGWHSIQTASQPSV